MSDAALRQHILALLKGGQAHMTFDDAIADFPPQFMNAHPPNVTYTPWHLLEHLRITQFDILEYVRNPDYVSPEWPKGYWPSPDAQADLAAWDKTVQSFRADLQAMCDWVADPKNDMLTPLPHGYNGHTLFREAVLIADHNAYHIGELGILRQVIGAWPKGHQ